MILYIFIYIFHYSIYSHPLNPHIPRVAHQDRADQDQLILAASKSVIAHLEGAAGVAGITKLVKMLEHKWLGWPSSMVMFFGDFFNGEFMVIFMGFYEIEW
jgi:hypothetical protein